MSIETATTDLMLPVVAKTLRTAVALGLLSV
jgi:hypothetical protein